MMPCISSAESVYSVPGDYDSLAELLESLPADAGEIKIILTANTSDTADIIVPSSKGITLLTITEDSAEPENYWLGIKTSRSPYSLYANGVPLVFEAGTVAELIGGGFNTPVASTNLTVKGGEFRSSIIGGGYATENDSDASVAEDVRLTISGVHSDTIHSIGSAGWSEAHGSYNNVRANVSVGSVFLTIEDSDLPDMDSIVGGSSLSSRQSIGGPIGTVGNVTILIENSTFKFMSYLDGIFGGSYVHNIDETQIMNGSVGNVSISFLNSTLINGGLYGGSNSSSRSLSDVSNVTLEMRNSSASAVFGGGHHLQVNPLQTSASDNIALTFENITVSNSICAGHYGYLNSSSIGSISVDFIGDIELGNRSAGTLGSFYPKGYVTPAIPYISASTYTVRAAVHFKLKDNTDEIRFIPPDGFQFSTITVNDISVPIDDNGRAVAAGLNAGDIIYAALEEKEPDPEPPSPPSSPIGNATIIPPSTDPDPPDDGPGDGFDDVNPPVEPVQPHFPFSILFIYLLAVCLFAVKIYLQKRQDEASP